MDDTEPTISTASTSALASATVSLGTDQYSEAALDDICLSLDSAQVRRLKLWLNLLAAGINAS